jgi:5-dehydro-2-deoxygluconokinase
VAVVIEAAVLGRVGVDLYPNQLRTPLRKIRTYTRFVGGFAGNVCTGLARLGIRSAIVSRVGDDGHGEFVRDFLSGEGVDVRFLRVDPNWLTPPTFCEIWPPDNFPIIFYRRPTVPDWQLAPDDFDPEEIASAPVLFVTGTGLAQSPSRETSLGALRAHRGTSIFDLDWRPTLWDEADDYRPLVDEAAAAADVVVGNEDEIAAAGGLEALLDIGPSAVIVKRGGAGATLFENGERTDVAGVPVEVVNGLGAGDAFAAGLGYAIVRGLGLSEGVRLGNTAGAIVASQVACSEAMPRLEELQGALV